MEIGSILVEGGGRLNGSLLKERLVDRVILYLAPKIVGGADAPGSFHFEGIHRMGDAAKLDLLEVEQIGDNVRISGIPVWPNS